MFQNVVDWLNWAVWTAGIPVGDGQTIPWVVILLLGAGFYLTVKLGFLQLRKLGHGFAVTTGKYDNPDDPGDVPHFQALTTALSATVGIGNIAGVALAIHFGGPGALFWMWMTALVGMVTKFSEVTLAQEYRRSESGEGATSVEKRLLGSVSGGPMFYIEKGLGKSWVPMAVFFAFMLMITSFLTGNAVQANTVADTMIGTFGVDKWITGVVLVLIIGTVVLGGIKRIGRVTSIVAPVMAAIYVLGGLTILAFNIGAIPEAFGSIFTGAFDPASGVAGTGAGVFLLTLMYGVRRGLFSNEAGMGSAPIAHSAAQTNEPVSEGTVALLEPFIDTIVICTITGLAIVVTGAWEDTTPSPLRLGGGAASYRVQGEGGIFADAEPPDQIRIEQGVAQVEGGEAQFAWNEAVVGTFYTGCTGNCQEEEDLSTLFTGTLYPAQDIAVTEAEGDTLETLYGPAVETGAPLTQLAFRRGLAPLGDWGGYIVVMSVLLFAISTAISWSYYGDRCAIYLFGERGIIPYKIAFLAMHFVGAVVALTTIWTIGDIALGIVIVPNLIAVLLLSGKLKKITTSYFERKPWLGNGRAHGDGDGRRQEQRRREEEEV